MTIIENKLPVMLALLLILIGSITITSLYNVAYATSFNPLETETLSIRDMSEFNDSTAIYQEQTVDVWLIFGGVSQGFVLQITDAPDFINVFTGFMAFFIYVALFLVLGAFIREMIGLT